MGGGQCTLWCALLCAQHKRNECERIKRVVCASRTLDRADMKIRMTYYYYAGAPPISPPDRCFFLANACASVHLLAQLLHIFIFYESTSARNQFEAEQRRWSIRRSEPCTFEEFYKQVKSLFLLVDLQFLISYVDPSDNDLLPINNDDNFGRALSTARPLLRIIIQRKGSLRRRLNNCWNITYSKLYCNCLSDQATPATKRWATVR